MKQQYQNVQLAIWIWAKQFVGFGMNDEQLLPRHAVATFGTPGIKIDRMTDWLTDWLTDCLTIDSTNLLTDWLTDSWLTD